MEVRVVTSKKEWLIMSARNIADLREILEER